MSGMMNAVLARIFKRRTAYRRMFLADDGSLNEHGRIVMTDLRKFCRATTSTAVMSPKSGEIDPIAMGIAEGRREVFNRINEYLYLKDQTITNMREEPTDD